MPENSASYDEIIAHFGEETIFNRYRFFFDKMQEYIKERNLESKLAVNETLLQHMIMDYFTDIFRLKMFHKIDRVNKAKIVAYEVYWILRRKPLQIKDFTTNESELEDEQKLAFANEGFELRFPLDGWFETMSKIVKSINTMHRVTDVL